MKVFAFARTVAKAAAASATATLVLRASEEAKHAADKAIDEVRERLKGGDDSS